MIVLKRNKVRSHKKCTCGEGSYCDRYVYYNFDTIVLQFTLYLGTVFMC